MLLLYLDVLDTQEARENFEALYNKYSGMMFLVANRILDNKEDAEDAVHEAFLAIAENFDKISSIHCPKTKGYIVTIVEHKAIDLYRKKQRHASVELLENVRGLEAAYEPEDGVARCMLQLPPRYRTFLLLHYDQGFTVRETARMMGISMANAYKLGQRAKKMLEELCKKEGVL
jgi:RNA polymerase sigma-70 factor (ECF subfamily)